MIKWQEVMLDPVIVAQTGHTYERASIVRWLQDHSTDPMCLPLLFLLHPLLDLSLALPIMTGRGEGRGEIEKGVTHPIPSLIFLSSPTSISVSFQLPVPPN